MEQYKINLLKLAAKYDFLYDVLWTEDLVFSITCSDVFHRAADAEEITSQEDVDMIEQAAKELLEIKPSADVWATLLFIARKRKMRPLGEWYLGLGEDIARLFDACRPEPANRNLFNELKEGIDTLGQSRKHQKELKDLEQPSSLSEDGKKAYETIKAFLVENKLTYTGGCKAFYSPEEWEIRAEKYGEGSVLIVVHDGGDLASIFNLDYECYSLNEKMGDILDAAGFYAEQATCWYTTIYKH